ncbi:carbohydrate ABC transporter permease [Paenibacillus sp. PL2-23]|uniref:carbohydrate ABC transporter permease n=1 Tax=Paenibacillus sp. PL2-23 TaxID=2100729 RepID=UPI0030FA047B
MKSVSISNKTVELSIHILFILISLAMLLPLAIVIIVSVTDDKSLFAYGYSFFPEVWSIKAYQYIFNSPLIVLRAYGVTMLTTILGTMGSLLLTAMVGYGLSRRDFAYHRPVTFYVFFTMIFSGGLIPSYILFTQYLHLKDTIWALILSGMLSPFFIMVMKGFLSKVPFEIMESAKIDGAGEWRIFFRIVVPLSTPALATLGLFISFNYWNAWFPALLYIDNQQLVPLQLLLVRMQRTINFLQTNAEFVTGLSYDISSLPTLSARMAMTVVAAGPMLFVFPFFQRYFVKGLTVGSLKS